MISPYDLSRELKNFAGRAPLFPLSNGVLFPHIQLPLQIVEPQYQAMLNDVLASDRFIAIALTKPVWGAASLPNSEPAAVYDTVCLGRVTAEERLPDGRFSLIVQGYSRAQLIEEEQTGLPYRVGRLILHGDHYPSVSVIDRENRICELIEGFSGLYSRDAFDDLLFDAVNAGVPLGVLCDVLTYAMKLEPSAGQKILGELDADYRSDLVLELIRETARQDARRKPQRTFPPKFSLN